MGCAPCPALAGVGWSGHGCLGARASGKIRDTGHCQVTPLCEAGHSESTMLRVITCPLGIVMTPLGHHTQVKLCVGETKCVGCLGGPGVGALRSSPRPLCGSGLELPWGTRDGVCGRGGAGSQPVCALPGQPSRTEACLLSQARPPPPTGCPQGCPGTADFCVWDISAPPPGRAAPRSTPLRVSILVFSGGWLRWCELHAGPPPGRLPAVLPPWGHGPCCGPPAVHPLASELLQGRGPAFPRLPGGPHGVCGVNGGRRGFVRGAPLAPTAPLFLFLGDPPVPVGITWL